MTLETCSPRIFGDTDDGKVTLTGPNIRVQRITIVKLPRQYLLICAMVMEQKPVFTWTEVRFITSVAKKATLLKHALSQALMPVSYTHLDVYKRQLWG